jgi:hypothetical protein
MSIYIRNITGKPISNYEYIVMVNAEKIAEGRVNGHTRKDGWAKLLELIAKDGETKKKK